MKHKWIGMLVLAAGMPVMATEPEYWMETVVVSARGRDVPAHLTPGSVSLLRQEDFDARGLTAISDLAGLIPGVTRTGDGPWGAEWTIRGLSRTSVILLIDGNRVNTATDLAARFGQLPPEAVQRVEILKGPISALYGSGALGGTVNILTHGGSFADQPVQEWQVKIHGGENPGGGALYTSLRHEREDRYVYAAQSIRAFDSYRDGNGDTVENTGYRDAFTLLKAGHRWSPQWALHGTFHLSLGDEIGIPGSGSAPLPAAADVTYDEVVRTLAAVTLEQLPAGGARQRSTWKLYHQYIGRQVRIDRFPANMPIDRIEPAGYHHTYGVKWMNEMAHGRHVWSWGLDLWQWQFETERVRTLRSGAQVDDQPLPDVTYSSYGLFAEDEIQLSERWQLLLGGRLDGIDVRNKAGGTHAAGHTEDVAGSAHAGVVAVLSPHWSWRNTLAAGYRAADLSERFQLLDLGGGVTKYGNPDLDPERSLMAETGLSRQSARWQVGLSLFVNELWDLIAEEQVDEATVVNRNVAEARIHGAELDGRWQVGASTRLYGNLAYVDGEDRRTGEALSGLAPLSGLLGIRHERDSGYWVRLECEAAARQTRTPPDVDSTSGWVVTNLRAGRRFAAGGLHHSVYIGAENLLDKAYRNYLTTWRGNTFNEPGRQVVAGYEILF